MTSADQKRMSLLTFVTVSVATMTGVILALVVLGLFVGDDDKIPPVVGFIIVPLPAICAALGFLFVARWESGRKGLAALAVLFGGLAATIVFVGLGPIGLVIGAMATGGIGVFARRLLDTPSAA